MDCGGDGRLCCSMVRKGGQRSVVGCLELDRLWCSVMKCGEM